MKNKLKKITVFGFTLIELLVFIILVVVLTPVWYLGLSNWTWFVEWWGLLDSGFKRSGLWGFCAILAAMTIMIVRLLASLRPAKADDDGGDIDP